MENKDQTEFANSSQRMAGKAIRWIIVGASMLLIGFTIYSAVMRKFGGG